MAHISNMEVRRVGDTEIVITEHLKDEIGCYVSKSTDDNIDGRYLHRLAIAVLESDKKTSEFLKSVESYLQSLDRWTNSNKSEREVRTAELVMRNAFQKFKGK
jgi:hypothetical protein